MEDILTAGNIIVALAFVAAFAAVMAIALPLMRRDPLSLRMESVANRREELSREQRESLSQQQVRWRPQAHTGVFRAILSQFRLESLASSAGVRQRLIMAGWRNQSAVVTYVFLRLASSVFLAFLILLVLSVQQRC